MKSAVCALTLLSFLAATVPAHASGAGGGAKKPGTALVPYRPQLPATTHESHTTNPVKRYMGIGATRSAGTRRSDIKPMRRIKLTRTPSRPRAAPPKTAAERAPTQAAMPTMPAMPRMRIARAVRVAAIAVMVLAVPTGFALVGGSYVALVLGGVGLGAGMMAFKKASRRIAASTQLAAAQYEQYAQFAAQQAQRVSPTGRPLQNAEYDPTPSDVGDVGAP